MSFIFKDNLKYNAHTGAAFLNSGILKFTDLVNLNQGCFMYKYGNGLLPYSFDNFFSKLTIFIGLF